MAGGREETPSLDQAPEYLSVLCPRQTYLPLICQYLATDDATGWSRSSLGEHSVQHNHMMNGKNQKHVSRYPLPLFQVSNKGVMKDQVGVRGSQLKVKYLYEDSTYNRKINAVSTATAQNGTVTAQAPGKPAPVPSLSKERSVDR